nr:bifunctional oligoribonuclease/PAP phosphatase NrnA [Candidatus Dormibacteraeota bacterium]
EKGDGVSPEALDQHLSQLKSLIDGSQEPVILSHKDADGDALGCVLAFAEALRGLGKTPHIALPAPLPAQYSWLPGFAQAGSRLPPGAAPDLAIFLDAASRERSGAVAQNLPPEVKIVNIDHHPSNTLYGDLNWIDADAAAVGQMCLDMFSEYGWTITPSMATNLYTALMTDTGGFRHENTNARALEDGARLVALGADPSQCATFVYKSRPLSTLKLSALSLATMRVEMKGRLVHACVSRHMLHRAGAVMAESEGIIDTLNSIEGELVAILFKEVSDRLTKISVRSREPVDAAALCANFGGGGHVRAAGAEIRLPLEEAVKRVVRVVRHTVLELEEKPNAGTAAGAGV